MTNKNHIHAISPAAPDLPGPATTFQPVVDTQCWHVPGHEARIERWLADGRLSEGFPARDAAGLEAGLRQVLHDARSRELGGDLYLDLPGLDDGTALLERLLALCEASATDPARLVLCLPADAVPAGLRQQLRLLGLRLAVPYPADPERLAALRPDLLRLPPWLARDLQHDAHRRRCVQEACQLATGLEATVLATGVGEPRAFELLSELGVHLMQGDWLAPFSTWPAHSVAPRVPVLDGPARLASTPVSADQLAGLVCDHFFVRPEATVAEMRAHVAAGRAGRVLPVVEAGRVLGVVDSCDLFAAPEEACARDRMRPARLLLPADGDARRLGELIQRGAMAPLQDDLLLVDGQGTYAGRIRLEDLFHALTGLTWQAWRYADPLTRLPGQVPVHEHVRDLMQGHSLFVVACIDIDSFQPYNDHYGYERGDEVLLALAELFRRHVDPQQDFLAHVGGDNFVIVFRSSDWFARCEAIERDCDALAPSFYSEAHRAAGGIESRDRLGRPVFHPLLALSMGIVQVEPGKFASHRDVMRAAREVKQRAQNTHGSTMFIDERSYGLAEGRPAALCN